MRTAILNRTKKDGVHETLGIFTFPKDDNKLFSAFSLELPWLNNEHNKSCIPDGQYTCKYTRSNRMSAHVGKDVFTYEVLDVKDRAGIRIHSANYRSQLLGCIALGDKVMDINADGEDDVANSRATIAEFEANMKYEDFILIIKSE